MHTDRKRIVVLGGGFAGVNTAQYLARRGGGRYDITIVSSRPMHTFTPWLYEVASGNTDAPSRATSRNLARSADIPLAALFADGKVRWREAVVAGLDHEHKHVLLEGGHTLSYDALVIGLGAESAYFGISGLKEFSLPLKSMENAVAIHRRISAVLRGIAEGERKAVHVLIAGAGPSGVELAAELATMAHGLVKRGRLAETALRLTLLDGAPRVLGMLQPKVSFATERRLRVLGIEVILDTMMTEAYHDAITVRPRPRGEKETTASCSPYAAATRIAADIVVWAGGIKPNAVLEHFALPKDPRGRIRVTPSFEVYSHPGIFALGDAALLLNPKDNQPLPQTAQAAEHASSLVASNVIRSLEGRSLLPYCFPAWWPTVIAVGGAYGVASFGRLVFTGRFGYLLRRAADFRYFTRTLPFFLGLRTWYRGVALYNDNDGQ